MSQNQKPYRIARYGIVHANLTAVITPTLGKSEGLQWTLKTLESIDVTLSLKYAIVGGTQITPVAIALAGSEPKWNGEMSFAEVRELRAWLGPGWAAIPMNMSLTWQVPGRPAFTDYIYDSFLGDDGMSSKKDGIVMSKVGSNITALHPNGIDPFADLGGSSGGGGGGGVSGGFSLSVSVGGISGEISF